jgi:hypothetical protein
MAHSSKISLSSTLHVDLALYYLTIVLLPLKYLCFPSSTINERRDGICNWAQKRDKQLIHSTIFTSPALLLFSFYCLANLAKNNNELDEQKLWEEIGHWGGRKLCASVGLIGPFSH